jgi:aminobenzoyl-glutamate utilization protein B
MYRRSIVAAITALFAVSAIADEANTIDFVDSRYDATASLARQIWEYAEVGYQEEKSSALLQRR